MVDLHWLPIQKLLFSSVLIRQQLRICKPSLMNWQAILFSTLFLFGWWEFHHLIMYVSWRRCKISVGGWSFRRCHKEFNGVSNQDVMLIGAFLQRRWSLTGCRRFKTFVVWEGNIKWVDFFLSDIHILLNFNSRT